MTCPTCQPRPRPREVKRGTTCLCGKAKPSGTLACRDCWDAAPVSAKMILYRSYQPKQARREAEKAVLGMAMGRVG